MAAVQALSCFLLGCSPYDHHHAATLRNVTRFGLPYVLHASPAPSLDAKSVAFTATFNTSKCADVTWSLEVDGHALSDVLVAVRHEESTRACEQTTHSGRVHVDLSIPLGPAVLIAFPPGSEYELMRLETSETSLLAGLAPPCPPAARRLFIHRAHPKVANPNGPCSTFLEVDAQATVDEVRALASERLGIDIAHLREEGAEGDSLRHLSDEAHLVAVEHGHERASLALHTTTSAAPGSRDASSDGPSANCTLSQGLCSTDL